MRKKAKLFELRRLPMDLARLVCLPVLLMYRVKAVTPEGKPYRNFVRGGAVVAANHTSFADPFIVGASFWYRRMYFLVAEIVMQGALRRWLLKGVGAIEINRNEADIEAMNKAIAVLREGRILTVFPQGGIHREAEMCAIKSGAVLMALRSGTPIVPMYIHPRKHWYQRQRVVIGEAIDPKVLVCGKFPSTADIQRVTEKLMEAMTRCRQMDRSEVV